MVDVILTLKENWNLFWGTGHYEILFLLSLLFVLFEKNNKNRQLLFWYPVVILFIVLNPLFAWIVDTFFLSGAVYTRLYLLIPIHVVIAYAMFSVLDNLKRISGKVILSMLFLSLLLFSGNTYYQEGLFSQADNLMKIPNETIDVCNILRENEGKIKVIAPADVLPYIRQYDADILLCYGRNGNSNEKERTKNLFTQFENPEVDVEYIVSEIRDMECEYIVYYKNNLVVEQFVSQGYVKIGETENYVVLKEVEMADEYR